MFRVLAALLLLSLTTPAYARGHYRAPSPTPAPFFALYQNQEALFATRNVRHVARHRSSVAHRSAGDSRRSAMAGFNGGSTMVVAEARSQIGNGAIYGRRSLWCARFVNWVLRETGYRGTGSDMAMSFASLPHTQMQIGAIAVMGRRGGGHVGIVSGVTAHGDPIVISGNHRGRVREAVYPRYRVHAYVVPR